MENDLHSTLSDALEQSSAGELELMEDGYEEYSTDVGQKAQEIKKNLEGMNSITSNLLFTFQDTDGEPLEPRETEGTLAIQLIPLDALALAGTEETQIRKGDLDIYTLQRNIEQVGLVNPLHVVPFGNPIGYDELGNPNYSRYIILDGRRRYEACRNLGINVVPALVNTTVNKSLIDIYQGIAQTAKVYTFSELVNYGMRITNEQTNLSPETIENFLGMKTGNFLKAQYIDQMKVDYPDIYLQVEKDKLSIEQGFKKLEKEIEKAEKAMEEGDMSEDDIDANLRGKNEDELSQLQLETRQQKVGDRHILDAVVRRTVETRDHGECQACGYGRGVADFMGVFNVHHIVAVQYGGSDSQENLILLCQNCHKLAHDYETGRFQPLQETFDSLLSVKRIIVLGNILRKLRIQSMAAIKKQDPNTFRVVNKGAMGLGKALIKAKVDLKAEESFKTWTDDDGNEHTDGSPYKTFVRATEKIEFGGDLIGDFAKLNDLDGAEAEEIDLKQINDYVDEEIEETITEHPKRTNSKEQLLVGTVSDKPKVVETEDTPNDLEKDEVIVEQEVVSEQPVEDENSEEYPESPFAEDDFGDLFADEDDDEELNTQTDTPDVIEEPIVNTYTDSVLDGTNDYLSQYDDVE